MGIWHFSVKYSKLYDPLHPVHDFSFALPLSDIPFILLTLTSKNAPHKVFSFYKKHSCKSKKEVLSAFFSAVKYLFVQIFSLFKYVKIIAFLFLPVNKKTFIFSYFSYFDLTFVLPRDILKLCFR